MKTETEMDKNDSSHIQILNLLIGTFTNVWAMKLIAEKASLPYADEITRLAESFTIHMIDLDAFNDVIQSEISDKFLAECLASGDYKNLQSFVRFAEEVNKKST
jgi:hypothetical protein